ncbi:MAG TPA: histidine kinase, partial [Polyangia bacterium]|nr:histidine kinase [Polyangia bacterium]
MGSPRGRSIFGVGTSIASVAVVVASLSSVLVGPVEQPVLLLVCGAAYLLALTLGVLFVIRLERGQHALVAALFVLGGANVWVSRGATILLLMPLVSLSVLWLTIRSSVALTVLLGIFVALVRSYRGGVSGLGTVADFGSAALFTVIFSRLLQREHAAALRIGRLAADVETRNEQLRASAARIQELATVQERNRIAREIHDSLGHYLTSAHVQLEVARTALLKGGTDAATHVTRAQELVHGGLG